jgi:hypothetical protein
VLLSAVVVYATDGCPDKIRYRALAQPPHTLPARFVVPHAPPRDLCPRASTRLSPLVLLLDSRSAPKTCIKAGHTPPALLQPILHAPITHVSTQVCPDLTYNDSLQYHYLGGVVFGLWKDWPMACVPCRSLWKDELADAIRAQRGVLRDLREQPRAGAERAPMGGAQEARARAVHCARQGSLASQSQRRHLTPELVLADARAAEVLARRALAPAQAVAVRRARARVPPPRRAARRARPEGGRGLRRGSSLAAIPPLLRPGRSLVSEFFAGPRG